MRLAPITGGLPLLHAMSDRPATKPHASRWIVEASGDATAHEGLEARDAVRVAERVEDGVEGPALAAPAATPARSSWRNRVARRRHRSGGWRRNGRHQAAFLRPRR